MGVSLDDEVLKTLIEYFRDIKSKDKLNSIIVGVYVNAYKQVEIAVHIKLLISAFMQDFKSIYLVPDHRKRSE